MLARNIIVEAGTRLLILGGAFAFIPFAISQLGLGSYGRWEYVLSLSTLTNLVQIPLGGVLIWRISGAAEHERPGIARRLLGRGVQVSGLVSLLAVGVAGGLATFQARSNSGSPSDTILLITGAMVAQGLVNASETIGAVSTGLGYNRHSAIARFAGVSSNYLVGAGCLGLGLGLPSLVVGLATMGLVGCIINSARLWKVLRGHGMSADSQPRTGLYDAHTVKYAFTMALGQIAGLAKDNGDRILTTDLASSEFTGVLGLANRLNVLIGEINRYTFSSIVPEIGTSVRQNNADRIERLSEKLIVLNALATGTLAAGLLASSSFVLGAWIGWVPSLSTEILAVVTVGTVTQLMLTGPASAICRGMGEPKYETGYVLWGLALNIVLSPVLIWRWGAFGKIAATAASLGIASILFVVLVTRSKTIARAPFAVAAMLLVVALTIGNLMRPLFQEILHPSDRFDHLLGMAVSSILSGALFLVVAHLLSPSVRGCTSSLFRRAMNFRRNP